MTLYFTLILFSGLVYVPLALGWAARGTGVLERDVSKGMMKIVWLVLEPVVILGAFWGLDLAKVADLAAAPVIGSAWMVIMLLPGWLIAAWMGLRHPQRGNFMLASMFSNNGITLGAFLVMLLLGQDGLAVAFLFMLGFLPLLLTVGFAIGKHSAKAAAIANGEEHPEPPSMGLLRLVPYTAMTVGLILNLLGANRPAFLPGLTEIIVYADVALNSFAIGTLFRLRSVRKYMSECLAMSGIKFIVSPLVGLGLYFLAAQVVPVSPLLLAVVIIQCSMPVAIMSVVTSRFCGLDMHLAAACWVFTTLAVAAVVPVLAYIVPQIA